MIFIEEIVSQMHQGATKPLRCLDSNGVEYVVKFDGGMTFDGLVKEWLGASLAKEFGLAVPAFDSAFLDQALSSSYSFAESNPKEEMAFASRLVADCSEYSLTNERFVDENVKRDVFVFDLWVQNHDRNLTEQGGNVNLLWSLSQGLYVIDHNLIFQPDSGFAEHHVFRSAGESVYQDGLLRSDYQSRLLNVMQKWEDIVSSIPKEWLEAETFSLNLDKIFQGLIDRANGSLWGQMS